MHLRQTPTRLFLLSVLHQTVIGSVIVNGHKVAADAMQYMASVQNINGHVCGGFLVSDKFILTAAHCLDQELKKVILGNHNLRNSKNRQIIEIKKKIQHPSYKRRNTGDDLMLLKLIKSAKLEKGVQTMQLPNENMKIHQNERCEIAGWGATRTGGTNVNDLEATTVSVIDIPSCEKAWPGLPQNVICARRKNNERTFNEADCGGPLVCNNTAVGIASFNRQGTIEGPSVFVNIIKYLQWINQTISAG